MIYNNINFEKWCVVEDIRRDLLPQQDIISITAPKMVGSHYIRKRNGTTVIEVDIRIIGKTRLEVQETANTIAQHLLVDEPQKLILRDEPLKYNIGILQGKHELKKRLYTGFVTLKFACFDPYKYSFNITEINLDRTYYNEGEETPCTLSLTTLTSDRLEIFLNNEPVLNLVHDFIEGDTVEINTSENPKERKIMINGENGHKYMTLDSDYFMIPKGQFTISASGTGTITYRKRWL